MQFSNRAGLLNVVFPGTCYRVKAVLSPGEKFLSVCGNGKSPKRSSAKPNNHDEKL